MENKESNKLNPSKTVEIFVVALILFIVSLVTSFGDIGPDALPTLLNIAGFGFLITGWVRLFVYNRSIKKERFEAEEAKKKERIRKIIGKENIRGTEELDELVDKWLKILNK